MSRSEKARHAAVIAVPLAVYAVLAVRAGLACRDTINPDAVAYLRNALYWADGRFGDAVSGYWSPMLSWCVAPLAAAGFDPLRAAYAVLGAWGALVVVFSGAVAERFGGIPNWLATIALLLVAESTVTWSATVFPDVILAACLMGYAAWSLRPDLFEGRSAALVAGALGGLAYLAKAFGLPFFLVHWPAAVALLAWLRGAPVKRAATTWLLGLVAFGAVTLPWVSVLSWKYGEPTYGMAGKINHAILGPDHRAWNELWDPVAGRVTGWETPETRPYRFWSPLESAEALRYQLGYSWATLKEIRGSLARFDWAGLGLVAAVLGPFVVLAFGRGARELEPHAWTTITVVLYSAPFALVYFTYRYTAPWLKPLTILVTVRLAWIVAERIREADWPRRRVRDWLARALPTLVLASFAAHVNVPFKPYTVVEPAGNRFDNVTVDSGPHREVAARLRAAGVQGPIACTRYWAGMYIGYFLDVPFAGSPPGTTAEACDEELRSVGVRTFLVDRSWPLAEAFVALPGWTVATTILTASGETLDVLVTGGER